MDDELVLRREQVTRALAGYSVVIGRRFGMNHEEVVPAAEGPARQVLLAELARIEGEMAA